MTHRKQAHGTPGTRVTALHQSLLVAFAVTSVLTAASTVAQETKDMSSKSPIGDAEPSDAFNRLNTVVLEDGKKIRSSSVQLAIEKIAQQGKPGDALQEKGEEAQEKREEAQKLSPGKPPAKLHPALIKEMTRLNGGLRTDESIKVLITFRDDLKVPRLPSPDVTQSRDSTFNKEAQARAGRMVEEVKAARAEGYRRLAADLNAAYGIRVIETFWLIKAVAADMPLSAVERLSARDDVMYVEPEIDGAKPPADSNNANDVDDGRARIVSDPYFNLGAPVNNSGFIGLLDTGIRSSHTLLNTAGAFVLDCTINDSCSGGNPQDSCNHGTSTYGILRGNGNLGAAFRGVTDIVTDSFQVYSSCGLNSMAAVRAFSRAVAVGDRVIVAEMQGSGGATSGISAAADAAFDMGAVIIAANGNASQVTEVGSPAVAHKVIGVGAVNVQTLATVSQINGPAADGRTKPDIQTPTLTETASNASDTAMQVFSGTSGATPYGAGAAALLRNFLRGTNATIDPGQVYSHLILSGQTISFNNTNGAGLINLPTNGTVWWGKVSVSNGGIINIPLNVVSGNSVFDGALWWPETAAQAHNDVDLSLIDPNGVVVASSVSISSVFERARASGSLLPGNWTLRVRGFSVPTAPQTVYYSAHVRP